VPYDISLVMALACAAFYYQAGAKETGSGVPWAGLSVMVSALVIMVFHGGFWAVLAAQLGLLLGITLYRVWRDPQ